MECITETVGPAGSHSGRWNLRDFAHIGEFAPVSYSSTGREPLFPADRASRNDPNTIANRKTSESTEPLKGDPDGTKPTTSTSDQTSPRAMHSALHLSQHHTHLQQVADGQLVDRGVVVMALDRGKLAQIDRRLLAELDHSDGPQMVKVPLSEAAWSTWRRYCDALGLTMGEGIAALIDSELTAVVEDAVDGDAAVLAIRADEQRATREAEFARRERDVKATEERQRVWSERLRRWEAELEVREAQVEDASKSVLRQRRSTPKIGRNDRCPCGSGLKHKHCHGLPARPPSVVPK